MEEIRPGFRFYPVEEELVDFYLRNKLEGKRDDIDRVIRVIDIYGIEPWNLSKYAGELCNGDTEQWFFFTQRQEREARGGRPNRTTATGYWKATGSPSYVYSSDNRVIGVKKTMVFYKGKAPTGRKTKWKMNEYRAIEEVINPDNVPTPKLRHEFSLCRVYVISGNFRAYDRRPLEIPIDEQCDITGTSSQNTTLIAGKAATSSGTSDSGELADLVGSTGNYSMQNRGAGFGTSGTSDFREQEDLFESSGNRTEEEMNEWFEQTLLECEQQWPHF